jgi:hypothetical protein
MMPVGRAASGPSLGLASCQQHAQHHPISQHTLHMKYTNPIQQIEIWNQQFSSYKLANGGGMKVTVISI